MERAKEVERRHHRRLDDFGIGPSTPHSFPDPSTGADALNCKYRGGGFVLTALLVVLHFFIFAVFLLVLGITAVYIDSHGLWPKVPALPTLPRLPDSLPDGFVVVERAVGEYAQAVRLSMDNWFYRATEAVAELQMMYPKDFAAVVGRRVDTAVASFDAVVASCGLNFVSLFQRR